LPRRSRTTTPSSRRRSPPPFGARALNVRRGDDADAGRDLLDLLGGARAGHHTSGSEAVGRSSSRSVCAVAAIGETSIRNRKTAIHFSSFLFASSSWTPPWGLARRPSLDGRSAPNDVRCGENTARRCGLESKLSRHRRDPRPAAERAFIHHQPAAVGRLQGAGVSTPPRRPQLAILPSLSSRSRRVHRRQVDVVGDHDHVAAFSCFRASIRSIRRTCWRDPGCRRLVQEDDVRLLASALAIEARCVPAAEWSSFRSARVLHAVWCHRPAAASRSLRAGCPGRSGAGCAPATRLLHRERDAHLQGLGDIGDRARQGAVRIAAEVSSKNGDSPGGRTQDADMSFIRVVLPEPLAR